MTEKKQINLRLSEEMINIVKDCAELENRSVNNFIENALKCYIEEKHTKKENS